MALPDSQSIRHRIGEIYQQGYVLGDDGAQHSISPIAVASWRGEFVRDLCIAERATSCVEVGMAWGLSTLHIIEALIANGASGRAHVVIDPMQTSMFHNAARRMLHDCGVDEMVEFYEDRSDIILPRLISEGRSFDFAFIDGDHHFEGAFVDTVFVDRLLKPGGVVALDDAWAHPVYLACKFLEVYLHYEPVGELLKPPGDHFAGEVKHRHRHDANRAAALPKMLAYRKPLKPFASDADLDFARFSMADANVPPPIAHAQARRLTYYGLHALSEGNRAEARRAFTTAVRLHPTRLKNYARLLRTMLPSWMVKRLSGQAGRGERTLSEPAD
ncbi:MAG TPA: class I SAM-dependent methyltransferase [Candidatus Binataceae bacterium]|nr:class I SAM-dependent methyltransferase [Candidatus Binataceae bacterium]